MNPNEIVDLAKKQKQAREKRVAYLNKMRESFQVVMSTECGREIIEYLVVESRAFSNALKSVSNLSKVYGVSADYFLGQSDFGKNILTFLTPDQVAKLIQSTQKEDENERH